MKRTPLSRLRAAIAAVLWNAAGGTILYGLLRGLERLTYFLLDDPKAALFGRVPWTYLFNIACLAVVITFGFFALAGVYFALTDDEEKSR
jgi:hypothetical protein